MLREPGDARDDHQRAADDVVPIEHIPRREPERRGRHDEPDPSHDADHIDQVNVGLMPDWRSHTLFICHPRQADKLGGRSRAFRSHLARSAATAYVLSAKARMASSGEAADRTTL